MHVAALADLHCSRGPDDRVRSLLRRIADRADVVLLCGDLTDNGMPEEARRLADLIRECLGVPVMAVLGNHDYEKDEQYRIGEILTDCGVRMLDGDACEVEGVSFVGVKGFAGGFRAHELRPWGERALKGFVNESMQEGLKLESALSRIDRSPCVVLLHYAPIPETLEGEPPEIVPFLGSSRLEQAIDRHPVSLVCHGHAHYGVAEGATRGGVPVYNVSIPVLSRAYPDRPPFRLFEVDPSEGPV